jgi:hypothetical protein
MKIRYALAALMASVALAQATIINFTLSMNGANEVPPTASTATGGAYASGISYDTGLKYLFINIGFGGAVGFVNLQGDFVGATINSGVAGATGPIVASLAPNLTLITSKSGIFTGFIDYSTMGAAAETALLGGNQYVNITSTAFPGGEIRGQLIPEPSEYAMAFGLALVAFVLVRRIKLATA